MAAVHGGVGWFQRLIFHGKIQNQRQGHRVQAELSRLSWIMLRRDQMKQLRPRMKHCGEGKQRVFRRELESRRSKHGWQRCGRRRTVPRKPE